MASVRRHSARRALSLANPPMKKTILFVLAAFSFPALAKIAANVPSDYPNYDLIDRLEAYGCANPTLRTLRPGAHADLRDALILDEAKNRNDDAPQCAAPQWLL